MLHVILPSTLTKENLASWLVENSIEKKIHVESKDLTADDISEFEHKSSAAIPKRTSHPMPSSALLAERLALLSAIARAAFAISLRTS